VKVIPEYARTSSRVSGTAQQIFMAGWVGSWENAFRARVAVVVDPSNSE
jgi:hypothetical protein